MQQTSREVCRISLKRFAANHLRGCWHFLSGVQKKAVFCPSKAGVVRVI
nr:MAG TPA: ATP-binding protein [Caudoviricetes sp.]